MPGDYGRTRAGTVCFHAILLLPRSSCRWDLAGILKDKRTGTALASGLQDVAKGPRFGAGVAIIRILLVWKKIDSNALHTRAVLEDPRSTATLTRRT